jgi:hypothetical protein
MSRLFLLSSVVLLAAAPVAGAQQATSAAPAALKLPNVAGTWVVRSMVGPRDSVIVAYVVKATADGKGWTMKFAGRDPIAARVVAAGGDSVVMEAGPYPSVLRAGETVTTRSVSHYNGDALNGTFEAHYKSGAVLKGKTSGTRRK